MKYILALTILFSSITVFAQKVKSDMDKTVDFTQYKSYKFLGWQKDSDEIMNELDRKRMRDAFKSEFDSRNLEYKKEGEEADMAVSLYLVIEQKTSTTAYTNHFNVSGGYGRYSRAGWGWGSGMSTTHYNENDYLNGTLVMDVYDEESGSLIWQGVATGTVKENPKKREKSIPKSVQKLMRQFPIKPVK